MSSRCRPVGGEFGATDLLRFAIGSDQEEEFFPSSIKGRPRAYFETGTDALAAIISKVRGRRPICCWLPSNFCRATVRRLRRKVHTEVRYYNELQNCVLRAGYRNAVVLVHYNRYDRKLIHDALHMPALRGAILIEDFVQAPFDIHRLEAHYGFNSLRKIGNIEIAVAYGVRGARFSNVGGSEYFLRRKAAAYLKALYLRNGESELERLYLRQFSRAERALLTDVLTPASMSERMALSELNLRRLRAVRRANHRYLSARLRKISAVKVVNGDYMYCMIKCKKRDELRKYLSRHRIFAAIHWADSGSAESETLLSLHVDQRYTEHELKRVADIVASFFNAGNPTPGSLRPSPPRRS